MATYLLGVGDRHLDNLLLDKCSGAVVPIDFGHAFGSATQLLPTPELMPFRLTQQICSCFSPLGVDKLVRDVMENAAGKEVVPSSEEITSNYITRTMMPCLSAIMSPFAFEVFATTIAVGSDNIAIYVAVFASEEYWEVAITIGLVLGMLYVCLAFRSSLA